MLAQLILLLLVCCNALDNGLAVTPPMGYNPWNAFREAFTEVEAMSTMDLLVERGFAEVGYTHFSLDGEPERHEHALLFSQDLHLPQSYLLNDVVTESALERRCLEYQGTPGHCSCA